MTLKVDAMTESAQLDAGYIGVMIGISAARSRGSVVSYSRKPMSSGCHGTMRTGLSVKSQPWKRAKNWWTISAAFARGNSFAIFAVRMLSAMPLRNPNLNP
eukprot:Amastigsp_a512454_35.p4 type:complete len:101 gc:universal Amastigsp_a512454_35:1005-703(-)